MLDLFRAHFRSAVVVSTALAQRVLECYLRWLKAAKQQAHGLRELSSGPIQHSSELKTCEMHAHCLWCRWQRHLCVIGAAWPCIHSLLVHSSWLGLLLMLFLRKFSSCSLASSNIFAYLNLFRAEISENSSDFGETDGFLDVFQWANWRIHQKVHGNMGNFIVEFHWNVTTIERETYGEESQYVVSIVLCLTNTFCRWIIVDA